MREHFQKYSLSPLNLITTASPPSGTIPLPLPSSSAGVEGRDVVGESQTHVCNRHIDTGKGGLSVGTGTESSRWEPLQFMWEAAFTLPACRQVSNHKSQNFVFKEMLTMVITDSAYMPRTRPSTLQILFHFLPANSLNR
uniref:Uncharacterized protein n=1 Tax=Pipistrellus kuhlii TaxID=59472 RepID=A0A7J7WLF6_PIPKU|nr:hypothetical protein mPipKuh1_007929 [Pipistrellus kuhlii]